MGENTKIEWTDFSWNGWIGCSRVSPGCEHCYAEAMAKRYGWADWGRGKERHRTSADNWRKPVKWNNSGLWCDTCGGQRGICGAEGHSFRRPRVFCASLSDWLDDEVPIEWLADLLKLIHDTPNLDWQLLTKRPENWHHRITTAYGSASLEVKGMLNLWVNDDPPRNCWIGTTVEDQRRADERIPELLKIPAKVRFLSVEPMLEPIDLLSVRHGSDPDLSALEFGAIHWVIVGGESGPIKRPFNPDWARTIKGQCEDAGVPLFFKQVDKVQPIPEDLMIREFPKV